MASGAGFRTSNTAQKRQAFQLRQGLLRRVRGCDEQNGYAFLAIAEVVGRTDSLVRP